MGVHDLDKYAEVKRLLGIPEDEPIFIIRAQDKLSEDAISKYAAMYVAEVANGKRSTMNSDQRKFEHQLSDLMDEFYEWQEEHPDKVKVPD